MLSSAGAELESCAWLYVLCAIQCPECPPHPKATERQGVALKTSPVDTLYLISNLKKDGMYFPPFTEVSLYLLHLGNFFTAWKGMCACHSLHVSRLEGNPGEIGFSPLPCGSMDQTQVMRLVGKSLYLLSHLDDVLNAPFISRSLERAFA